MTGGDQGATAGVPPHAILEVLEGDLGEDGEGPRVSPQGPAPHPPSTLPSPPAAARLPARASCGERRSLRPPPGLIGWAGRRGPRSWRLGIQERKSTGEPGWHCSGEGAGGKSAHLGAGQTWV